MLDSTWKTRAWELPWTWTWMGMRWICSETRFRTTSLPMLISSIPLKMISMMQILLRGLKSGRLDSCVSAEVLVVRSLL
ncbi:hypothetical protein MPTK1_6g10430 [Marchantia polymorpha subsp. ruderalis]